MKALCCLETSEAIMPNTKRRVSKDLNPQKHRSQTSKKQNINTLCGNMHSFFIGAGGILRSECRGTR